MHQTQLVFLSELKSNGSNITKTNQEGKSQVSYKQHAYNPGNWQQHAASEWQLVLH